MRYWNYNQNVAFCVRLPHSTFVVFVRYFRTPSFHNIFYETGQRQAPPLYLWTIFSRPTDVVSKTPEFEFANVTTPSLEKKSSFMNLGLWKQHFVTCLNCFPESQTKFLNFWWMVDACWLLPRASFSNVARITVVRGNDEKQKVSSTEAPKQNVS